MQDIYYYFEHGKDLISFKNHSEAFKMFDKSKVRPRAVVLVRMDYFKPLNCAFDNFDLIQHQLIKQPFYDLGLNFRP